MTEETEISPGDFYEKWLKQGEFEPHEFEMDIIELMVYVVKRTTRPYVKSELMADLFKGLPEAEGINKEITDDRS